MRIFFLSSDINSVGGIQKYTLRFIKTLKENGFDVCTLDRNPKESKLRYVFVFLINILKKRPSLIIAGHLNFSFLCFITKLFFQIDYVIITHGIEVWKIKNKLSLRSLKSAKQVITVSIFTRNKILSQIPRLASKICVIPNTIDGEEFFPEEKSIELLKKYNLSKKDKIILTVCRLSSKEQYKGYDKIIEALPLIKKKIPEIKYLLVGGGDDFDRIIQMVKKYKLESEVIMTGYVPKEDLIKYYNCCDVFAMPSKGEGFGIVFLEALACGKPVVAGNEDASREAVLDGKLGILVNPEDINQIANAIIKNLSLKKANTLLYKQGVREEILKTYGVRTFQEKIIELMEILNPFNKNV